MRLNYLELIRYGKFTDRRIELPVAERDFHVIVGPNEAGKSTARSAVSDLLYGIPARTRLDFVHAMPDLRLGAGLAVRRLAGEAAVLDMQRVKGNKQTLRDPTDKPLADNALAPFLGTTDRDFFSHMFSLDHERMVKGGRSILSASDNLGQILFQSAAGIASLGSVRDDLEAQADKLWSQRKSKDRQYYVAADALDSATTALKQATVRTKDWTEAQAALAAVEQNHDKLRQQLAEVRQRRSQLERIRRVLPTLQALQAHASKQAEMEQAGPVVELPVDAAQALIDAERAIGVEQVAINHQQALLEQAKAALALVDLNTPVLEASAEIAELDAQRLQYRAYPGDITRRQSEIDAQWGVVQRLAKPMGWATADVQNVQAQLPTAVVRAALARLARASTALHQAAEAADRTVQKKQAEFAQAQAELDKLPAAQLPADLQAALNRAKKLGDAGAAAQTARALVDQQAAALEAALAALGRWRVPVAALQSMTPPAPDLIHALGQAALNDAAQARALASRITQLQQQCQKTALEAKQYQASHDTVSLAELTSAREMRDQTWHAVKDSHEALLKHGAEFELQLGTADAMADRRHDTAQEASELQSRLTQLARVEQELAQAQDEQTQLSAKIEQRQQRWSLLASECGLPGLPFEIAPSWLESRSAAMGAAATMAQGQGSLQRLHETVASVCADLASALGERVDTADIATLDRLILVAEARLQTAASIGGRRQALDRQLADAQRDLLTLVNDAQSAQLAKETWSAQWRARLQEARFPAEAEPTVIEAQLADLEEMSQALDNMRHTQVDRIDKMKADLDQHAQVAKSLAQRLQPDLLAQSADAIALALAGALGDARQAHARAQQLRAEVAEAERQLRSAMLRHDQARASVGPLMQRAGVDSIELLAAAIGRSDQWRALRSAIASAERAASESGDGLSLAQLQAEATQEDPSGLVGTLSSLVSQEDELVTALSTASAQRQAANAALQAIAGTADAAKAEAQRQLALAAMADAVERYVKVFTAAKLLRWSIEQYREAKQGPMLSAASTVFAQLTLGSFDRLVVDFEHDPPQLQGRRHNGQVVDIEGMSEGTQDQLFLALRLAALDMHLDHAQALPFIADDLFINYDDLRAKGGLQALGELSRKTQVLFLTHHEHLLPVIQDVFGGQVNIVRL